MKRIKRLLLLLFVFLFLLSGNAALAGSSQADGEQHLKPEEIISFSKKVEKTLAQKGARVAIIGRVGRPRNKLPEGLSFTHTAIAVYSQITTADGRKIPGYAIYNLYQRADEPDVSDLIQDFPVDFFSGVDMLEAGLIIPSPELQKRLLKVLASPTYKELHNPHYSVIANPFTLGLQNCTEFVLDVLTAAIYETNDIKIIKANEKAYFEPQPVNVNPVKIFFGSMFSADVATSDHPDSPVMATFTTIGNFLKKYNAASDILIVKPDVEGVK
ncbi:DUF2145 domain-containing protein [Desulforhopalus vacuolatus]|uniref:DUF2145 domain-containing protein n=1 Tax=Desulforhopalus vacuolatus TaxID=40414 RepID=UPI0019668A93|nr:DUF2145 domain-containing protein [Desulforhopalus vacuolatus]MBM9521007.1 DUF2145 domain-containing protein [Desulforhopalus vacuolatus]